MTDYKWMYGDLADLNGDGKVDLYEALEEEYAYDTLMGDDKPEYADDDDDDDEDEDEEDWDDEDEDSDDDADEDSADDVDEDSEEDEESEESDWDDEEDSDADDDNDDEPEDDESDEGGNTWQDDEDEAAEKWNEGEKRSFPDGELEASLKEITDNMGQEDKLCVQYNVLKNVADGKEMNEELFITLTQNIIAPMFAKDTEKAIKMWEYLLVHYYKRCCPRDYRWICEEPFDYFETYDLLSAVKESRIVRKFCFLLNPDDNPLYTNWFIRDALLQGEAALSDCLIDLRFKNTECMNSPQKNLYKAFSDILCVGGDYKKIKKECGKILVKWAEKLEDPIERTMIEVKLNVFG